MPTDVPYEPVPLLRRTGMPPRYQRVARFNVSEQVHVAAPAPAEGRVLEVEIREPGTRGAKVFYRVQFPAGQEQWLPEESLRPSWL